VSGRGARQFSGDDVLKSRTFSFLLDYRLKQRRRLRRFDL